MSGQLSRCQLIRLEVDQGLEVPDAAEAPRKTSVLEAAEDLRAVLTRTGCPGLRAREAALAAGGGAGREEDHPKTVLGFSRSLEPCVFYILFLPRRSRSPRGRSGSFERSRPRYEAASRRGGGGGGRRGGGGDRDDPEPNKVRGEREIERLTVTCCLFSAWECSV